MVSAKLTAVALASLVLRAAAATINTPTALIQCQPVQLSQNVFLAVLPGGQSAALPIVDFGELPASPAAYTWTVNVPAGTSVTLRLTDSTGVPAYTEQVTIQPGSSSCSLVDASGSTTATSAAAGASSSAANTRSSAAASQTRSSAAAGGASSAASSARNSASSGASAPASSASNQPTSGASALTVGSGLLAGVAAIVAVVA
ncbi:hypothetical protein ACM66B_006579 [Microbotryomycetes sp. NB124-2]